MRHINGVYTERFNRHLNSDGQLFRGRYKSVIVEEDSHLPEVLRYIHRNPLRAGMCKSVSEYPWSSHNGYISHAKKWDWLNKGRLLGMFAKEQNKALHQYKSFVQCEEPAQVTTFYSKKNLPSFFGSEESIAWVKTT